MKKKGLIISNIENSIDKAILEKQELRLLAFGDGTEIMVQEIDANVTFDVFPSEGTSSIMEFFYIIEGQLEYLSNESNNKILNTGDYIYAKQIEKVHVFNTLTPVKMLYVSTEPIFHYLGESLKQLHIINRQVDRKDKYTYGHSERVQNFSIKTALKMGLERESFSKLAIASLFHDVGKIEIPNYILKKPSSLTSVEFEIIKSHVEHSANLVKSIKYYDSSDIVMQHHERLDGSGYPKGLKGDEISIEAKIIAVVDSFDAMTSDRPYRKAFTKEYAINEIRSLVGKHFDKSVVDAFVEVLEENK